MGALPRGCSQLAGINLRPLWSVGRSTAKGRRVAIHPSHLMKALGNSFSSLDV